MKVVGIFGIVLIIIIFLAGLILKYPKSSNSLPHYVKTSATPVIKPTIPQQIIEDPLSIKEMQKKKYPGSDLVIEKQLSNGLNYKRYIVSYISDGLKQFALLTVPIGVKPDAGWSVILFDHGYIPPANYVTETSYASMLTPLASAGYIVLKPDYRGNGNSQGTPKQIYISPDYVTDSMNALESIKKYPDANPNKIGVVGHSMGGNILFHQLLLTKDFKAAVILAGTVGDEQQLYAWWQQRVATHSIVGNDVDTSLVVQQMVADHGIPNQDSVYWNSIDPNKYIHNITTPIQIHVGSADTTVPPLFSTTLRDRLKSNNKKVAFYEYTGADHNLLPVTNQVMEKTVAYLDIYLK